MDRANPGGQRRAGRGALGLEAFRLPQLSGPAAARQPGARAAAAPAALLQPARLRNAALAALRRGNAALAAAAGLLVHIPVGPGDRLQPPVRDRLAADDRLPEG